MPAASATAIVTVRPAIRHLAQLLGAVCLALPLAGHAACVDEESEARLPAEASSAGANADSPRMNLQAMVQEAFRRSQTVGAAALLAQAAQSDLSEAKAGALPQASISGSVNHVGSGTNTVATVSGMQSRAALNVGASLFDGGRQNRLTDWRSQLAEAAQQGQLSAREQVALQTVSLALERSRYRLQAQVYQQHARKMGCLVEALQTIVNADKGRASELVQARKTLQQTEMSYAQTMSQVRQTELRLRRFVGDGLPPVDGLSSVLIAVPKLEEIQADAARAADINQLTAQADAADQYASAVRASGKPQVGWSVSGSKSVGVGSPIGWSAGVNVTIPLFNQSTEHAATAAELRARAARLQRDDAIEGRVSRAADVHEQAISAFDRARRVVDVLRDSNQVRAFTLQQWQQLGKRSLFDVMSSESDHYGLRVAYVNALYDGEQANALLWSLGRGIGGWLQ